MVLPFLYLAAASLLLVAHPAEAFAVAPHSSSPNTMIVRTITSTSSSSSRGKSSIIALQMSPNEQSGGSSSSSSDVDRLRDSATRLRKEAEALEAKMAERRTVSKKASDVATTVPKKKVYTTLDDSEWTISYRFASDPPPKDDDKDGSSSTKSNMIRNYSGKVAIKFRNDGYTDIISTDEVRDIQYAKFWGWDEETSTEDDLRYILFSTDVVLPETDNNAGTERFYFQARIEQNERTGEISLADGKVTVKRDIEPPGGFWGLFNGGGILAQFRVCGDFVCRPR